MVPIDSALVYPVDALMRERLTVPVLWLQIAAEKAELVFVILLICTTQLGSAEHGGIDSSFRQIRLSAPHHQEENNRYSNWDDKNQDDRQGDREQERSVATVHVKVVFMKGIWTKIFTLSVALGSDSQNGANRCGAGVCVDALMRQRLTALGIKSQ